MHMITINEKGIHDIEREQGVVHGMFWKKGEIL